MTETIRIHGLTRRYGPTLAVAGVDLSVEDSEILGLVGPNGAGKTTTLKMLATLLVPSSGDATIMGHSIRRDPDRVRRVIGYMPDSFGVYDDMRVWEYLDFFARCYSIPGAKRKRLITDLLELVDLAHKRDDYVQSLSRGMQQRLCLAHTLVHDPPVLLLDEPASGLDPRARVELRELIRELRDMGKTVVISSHILPELEELCTRVAIIDHGRVLAHGEVAEIERRLRRGSVLRITIAGDSDAIAAAERALAADPSVTSATTLPDGRIEIGVPGDDVDLAALLGRLVREGHPIAAFAPAVSDLEELFLQVTALHAPGGEASADASTEVAA
jgi:ABC-2 type transport system ATP-binding protein